MGSRSPAMPLSHSDGEDRISTLAKRPSYCSERLRTKRGQFSAPGIRPFRCESIWQPLQTPRVSVSGRAKKAPKASESCGLNRMVRAQPAPAPSTSPYEKPPQATSAWNCARSWRPAIRSLMCTS